MPAADAPRPRPDPRGEGLLVGDRVTIAEDVAFGGHVVVHDGATIGAGCVIEDHVVLGKRPRLAGRSSARGDVGDLVVGDGVTICCAAVVFAGARIAAGAIIGDQSYVRERAQIGAGTLIGRGSVVDNDVVVGARVSVQTGVYLAAGSVIEDDVFVGPGVVMTNDNTMSRHRPGEALAGVILRRACRVGGGSVLVPGVEVGEEAFVAAGAVVVADVPPRAVVMGVPARVVREVADEDLIERWQ